MDLTRAILATEMLTASQHGSCATGCVKIMAQPADISRDRFLSNR